MKKATPTRLPDRKKTGRLHQELPLHLMLLPGLVIILIYNYAPMFGLLMAFENYKPTKGIFGSAWVGLENFRRFFAYPDALRVIYNTVFIAVFKLVLGILVPVLFALLVNEIKNKIFSGYVQLVTCLPYFLSWVILGGIFTNILSPSNGLVNEIIRFFGGEPVYFLGENSTFPWTLIITDTWKNFGYSSIIYLAAMSSIDPALYEAAEIDGAGKIKQILHVTLPGIMPTIVIMLILRMGSLLGVGFEKIILLYNANTYETADVISSYVYRRGLQEQAWSYSSAVGLVNSVINFILIIATNWFSRKVNDVSLW